MRILQIAPAHAVVGPQSTDPVGATIYHLVEGLSERGHAVTLWAPAGSESSATLRTLTTPAPGADAPASARAQHARLYAVAATADAGAYDLIHNHAGEFVAGLAAQASTPILTTVYANERPRHLRRRAGFTGVSWRQQAACDWRLHPGFLGVIYPGVPVDDLPFGAESGEYLLYAAPLTPVCGFDLALDAARRSERPLHVAGYAPPEQRAYWEPLLAEARRHTEIRLLGPLSQPALAAAAAGAWALIQPTRTAVDFDFATVTALAAGAPVVANRRGALPELVVHGETGFVVDEPWQLAGAVDAVDLLERAACRRRARALFDAPLMVARYEEAYAALLGDRALTRGVREHPEFEALDPRRPLALGGETV